MPLGAWIGLLMLFWLVTLCFGGWLEQRRARKVVAAAAELRTAQREYMFHRTCEPDMREHYGELVAEAAGRLDVALANWQAGS